MARAASTPSSRRSSTRLRKQSESLENDLDTASTPTPTPITHNKSSSSSLKHQINESDAETPITNKRRKSSRVSNIPDYAPSKKAQASNGKQPKSKKKDHNHNIIDKNGVKYIEDTKSLDEYQSRELDHIDLLGHLSAKHKILTQELFHLEEFTSLVSWDPEATPSKYYQDFVDNNYDLWKESEKTSGKSDKPSKTSRSTRRPIRSQSSNTLKPSVEDSETKFLDEVFNPSKFYHDQFLIEKTDTKVKIPLVIQHTSNPIKDSPLQRQIKIEDTTQSIKKPSGKKKAEVVKIEQLTPSKRKYTKREVPSTKSNPVQQVENESSEELTDDEYKDLSPEPYFRKGPIPRVKLHLSLPEQTVTNPDHLSTPEHGSLEAYLNSYKSLDEDVTAEEFEEYTQEQKGIAEKIRRAVKNKVLTFDEQVNIHKQTPPQPYRDPLKNRHTHHDHLVGQAVHLSKLLADSRKARVQRARKVAQLVESHFKRQAGAKERERKEEEKRLKTLARNAVQAVKKRWILGERVYRVLKNQEAEELKRIKGKEHLSQMLEHSTQLLEAQLTKQSDEEDNEDDDDEQIEELDESDFEGRSKILDEEDDSSLTVEQLQAKYANLKDLKLEEVNESEQSDDDSDDQNNNESNIPVLTEEQQQAVENANKSDHDTLLDSDTSLDSDDDSDISSSEIEDDEDEDISNGKASGLQALFGNNAEEEDEEQDYESAPGSESENDKQDDEIRQESDDSSEEVTKQASTPSSTPGAETKNNKSRLTSQEPNEGVVDVPTPSLLLRGNLRSYQKQGLNWLASLYNNHTNGILADEMGLGKTIQTISLISYLAVTKGIWGPHLIIVPTSVLLNWEMEFKRFAPGFKVMVYYGSPQQRKEKRKGWNKPDTFHVCITSYQLVCQDQQIFKRKRWRYMILDEAHNIKNFKSNRWNALLNFNTENRLLLTGTPLQNNIMELWSLLYFLMPSSKADLSMPSGFANLEDFQQWFGKPVDKIIEGGVNQEVDAETRQTVAKLHQVLRPYLLRRLKADVESQMPGKYEHIVYCRLSKRQYKLYHEYLARSDTKAMLKNANYISIINALMQLRKVCNHPDLFEERPITTSFAIEKSVITPYKNVNDTVLKLLNDDTRSVGFEFLNLNFVHLENGTTYHANSINKLKSSKLLLSEVEALSNALTDGLKPNYSNIIEFYKYNTDHQKQQVLDKLKQVIYINNLRCDIKPVYGKNLINELSIFKPLNLEITAREDFIKPLESRIFSLNDKIDRFAFVTPKAVTLNMSELSIPKDLSTELSSNLSRNPLHKLQTKLSIQFPDKSLLLYDCGKLQKLAKLLQQLKDGGHRALIFTQMTKVLDILEQFLNIMGIRYMRLDGSTKIEDRQVLTERFNSDPKIMVFILSTRSGGLGINLTGADTVIFYDSDWNPAMDKQCQDRCHRIGQTRDVHIYRFVSEYTIESNILKKANQKRHLDDVIIQEGEFTTDYFGKLSVKDLIGNGEEIEGLDDSKPLFGEKIKIGNVLAQAEDAADAQAAKEAMKEVDVDNDDFVEEKAQEEAEEIDDYEGTGHVDEYMIRFIANGYYYD